MVRHTGEGFINEEGVAVSEVSALQSSRVYDSELDAPQANCFAADGEATLGLKIFDISVT
jgi:hypothetical protein